MFNEEINATNPNLNVCKIKVIGVGGGGSTSNGGSTNNGGGYVEEEDEGGCFGTVGGLATVGVALAACVVFKKRSK